MDQYKKTYTNDDNIRSITFSNKDQVRLQEELVELMKFQNKLFEDFLKKTVRERDPINDSIPF